MRVDILSEKINKTKSKHKKIKQNKKYEEMNQIILPIWH